MCKQTWVGVAAVALAASGCAVGSVPEETTSLADARLAAADGAAAPDGASGGSAMGCDPQGGTCFDPATGLTWQNPAGAETLTFAEARAHCAGLSLAGGGWRLPRVQELRSLIRGCPNTALGGACRASDPSCTYRACMEGCDQCSTTIINGVKECLWGPEMRGSCELAHWSSSIYADSIDPGAWYVDFGNGAFVHGWLQSQPLLVRCVR